MNDQAAASAIPPEKDLTSLRDAMQSTFASTARVIYWYDIPPRIAATTGVAKIGMVELYTFEELMATNRAPFGNVSALSQELAKEAIRFVNDEKVNSGDGSVDRFWASQKQNMARLRQLVTTAYGEIHNPDQGETKVFLQSRREAVG